MKHNSIMIMIIHGGLQGATIRSPEVAAIRNQLMVRSVFAGILKKDGEDGDAELIFGLIVIQLGVVLSLAIPNHAYQL